MENCTPERYSAFLKYLMQKKANITLGPKAVIHSTV